jgi:serine/threonine-protein kinase
MKIRSLLPVILAVFALGFAPVLAQQTPMVSISNSSSAYRMTYPDLWSKTVASSLGAEIALVLPVSEGDLFQENLNVVIRRVRPEIALAEYSESAVEEIRAQIAAVKIVETGECFLGGRPAFRAVFTGRLGSLRMKWMQVWTLKDGQAYILTYSAEEAHYARELASVQSVVDSFEFR